MATSVINSQHIRLARQLPRPLLNFFQRHPPGTYNTSASPSAAETASRLPASTPIPSLQTLQAAPHLSTTTNPPATPAQMAAISALYATSNPFLPWQNPLTSAWRAPRYSARHQQELYTLAKKEGVLSLLPESERHPEIKGRKREEQGLRVKGTGVGQKVKGREWERQLRGKQEMRRKAMEGMAELVREWKERGHGRGWKKWPK
ncbi:4-coumarate--CoA ligase-like 7 [Elsinoe australis]|uniref:4-coumarate--CoA ligase-like 7 n=1 Tax=Elsinoe australis TaxID=40998 RepID=A0A2P7Z6A2_9PEZI|nr:4-coumarate--CoA ligase-like 7 [Elsinoe australis]